MVGVLEDMNDEAEAAESPQPVAPVCAAPETVRAIEFSDIASTMARLEQRLNTMAAEVGGLIHHMEESKSRPPSQSL